MEDKMESEHSYSGESSSSSDSSSGSSDGDEEVMEPVRILGHTLELPQELCEDYGVFKEFFSMKTWDALEDKHKEHLMKFLPKFTENDEDEKEKTIKMLFNHDTFHFTSPLGDFYNNLRQGNYRPDIAKMRKFLMRARAKQQRHKIKSYYAKLLPEVLISRERLLAAAKAAPPGPTPRLPLLPPKPSSKNNYKPVYVRARQRYFEELAAIRSEVGGEESEDENYPEGPPEQYVKKRKQINPGQNVDSNVSGTLGGTDSSHPTSLECLKNVLAAHRARRQYRENHPELNTTGINLEDIKQRVALVNGAKKLMFGGQKTETPIQKLRRGPKKEASQKQCKPDVKTLLKKGKEEQESVENKPLLPNIKIKCEQEESDSESSSFVDPVTSPKQSKKILDNVEIKQEIVDIKYPDSTNINYNEPKLESIIKQEPQDPIISVQNTSRMSQPVPIKLEDLDGIDMMALPVELADDSGEVLPVDTSETMDEILVDADESLTETTHANFLSLVRALFPARAAHRASKQQLHARCAAVMRSPIAPLNTWYNLSDDWCAELDSALDFLAGERGPHPDDFVPYLQYMSNTQMYQWIGAGRDCDALLGRLYERWRRTAVALTPATPATPATPTTPVTPSTPVASAAPAASAAIDPPPPRYPTSWIMRPPTSSEIAEFRAQERRRFSSAAKPFTYIQHGYRSVVGPCARMGAGAGAGAGAAAVAGAGAGAGAAGVLAGERPRHANFVALVRDAIARLPNGEGSRHDVLTLLKMSQWIVPCSDQTLLSVLTSALDRLHSAKRDPVVKYDQRTAVWTYMHRHRSEEDWLKSTSGRGRGGKAVAAVAAAIAVAAAAPPPPPPPPPPPRDPRPHTPPALELEVASIEEVVDEASDSDVDVDDSGTSSAVPHLSSAQLLMQATQASQAKHLHQHATHAQNKPKGKLVATPPQKVKTNIQTKLVGQTAKQANLMVQSNKQASLVSQSKQTTLMAQSAKQATLMSQSTKQANVIAQLTKQNAAKQPNVIQSKINVAKQAVPLSKQTGPVSQLAKQSVVAQTIKQAQSIKQNLSIQSGKQTNVQAVTQIPKSSPSVIATPHKSPLVKQRPLQKVETLQTSSSISVTSATSQQSASTSAVIQPTVTLSVHQNQSKLAQGTRSLLIRPPSVQTTVTVAVSTPTTQGTPNSRRNVLKVISPATPSSGKSLISPRALMQQGTPTTKKRTSVPNTVSVTTIAQSTTSVTSVVSSVPTVVTSSMSTRTVQLAGGRTVQLAANQTVHLPGGQAVQLSSGHTLQLSSLQMPTHSVRLPSGQTVQLASPQTVQAVRAASTTAVRNLSPRAQQSSPTVKTNTQTSQQSTVQIPVSTVQLAGQTVQIAGQSVQLAGHSVQLTGHTVKLPSGQSVQVASQSVLPSQSVQLSSGQTVQLASGNVQAVQLGGQNVQLSSGQSVQMPSGQSVQLGSQTVQIAGQTVQLAGGQTVQLPSGQTLQLSSGQTVQLSSGQTLQLASAQTVQLANQQTSKSISQVVRSQASGEKPAQPIVAKLLTNAQGQMISLEGVTGVTGVTGVAGGGRVRVLPPAARLARPLLLTSAKPLHNIILQQSDGSAIRVTSSGTAASSQTIVLSNIGAQAVTTSTTSAPILKLQQVNPIQQVKLPQGIKIQQASSNATVATSSGVNTVRSVLMDGQQLKLVGGRHMLAKLLRPSHPPQ